MPARPPARRARSRKPLAALGPGPRYAPPRCASVARRRLVIASLAAIVAAAGVLVGPSTADGAATRAGSPVGKAEHMIERPGGVRFVGWAVDPSTRSPVTVVISVDGSRVASTSASRARRQPVAAAHRGFDVTVPVSEGKHTLCVSARNVGRGADTFLRCLTTTLDYGPVGAVESVTTQSGSLHVKGWAFDKDVPTWPVNVTVTIDRTSRTLSATRSRPDVAGRWSYAGTAHGFDTMLAMSQGTHRVCVSAHNLGDGSDNTLTCRTVTRSFAPTVRLYRPAAAATGARISGWAVDPDTGAPISVRITVDGHAQTLTANRKGSAHSGHMFGASLRTASGAHTICATALNAGYGHLNSAPACQQITLAPKPLGRFDSLTRASDTVVRVKGWTFDPDTSAALAVTMSVDGRAAAAVRAGAYRPDVGRAYAGAGSSHGFDAAVSTTDGAHSVCLLAKNAGAGSDTSLGCKMINAVHPVVPTAPRGVKARPSSSTATVTWAPPGSDGGAPVTGYVVTWYRGTTTIQLPATARTTTITGLLAGRNYFVRVRAMNVAGQSAVGYSAWFPTQSGLPLQRTPAPVSTSRYIRNVRGSSAAELATMRSEGAADAGANPTGHRYLVLLDIGGQDQYDGGVVLSATTRFVTYRDLVRDVAAYTAGYHSAQRSGAPVTIAIGTNNDMDVSYTSGKGWAQSVINPIASYARSYSSMSIVGANDIEPGFRASYSQTERWQSGYLAGTTRPFVFNGSADGCAWTAAHRRCNNGWTMYGLYRLTAGAAPTRTVNLPQVYNDTMADQWKYISITGIEDGHPRISFGGPLTEWTACDQDGGCGSLTGHTAWARLWSNLQSDRRLQVTSLPYSTDLRIDR